MIRYFFPESRLLMMTVLFLSGMFGGTATQLLAQKVEMEERVSADEFPPDALREVRVRYPNGRRMKLYRERSNADSLTYEAKLLADGYWYSVEFFPDGSLLDIEKKIKFSSLPTTVRGRIQTRWQEDFRKYKVVKCQEQRADGTIRYEIEVRGKGAERTAFYQYLFRADGTFVHLEKIALRPSDMTLY
ncbi:hypothetical protein [Flavilitoribacter nigricans]|uniref:Uncharacterized protein n=1 Tax=Flavilitoribacter nigricans (strain ATCC 23147 / DSM 23189 / NBRC 102662 / NCIMB 1420 / SS-2) TaxID=1122177 RepID=A0A2D0NAK4_FLAN2|nr:hypothetical protein [Flavilitoribacter nigricans]PHN05525.1 hypothetical protein CRP01_16155 [Flavilitoribacter nigricans DSM 23189 = NBRC 102662]